jgi:hypothetical protein
MAKIIFAHLVFIFIAVVSIMYAIRCNDTWKVFRTINSHLKSLDFLLGNRTFTYTVEKYEEQYSKNLRRHLSGRPRNTDYMRSLHQLEIKPIIINLLHRCRWLTGVKKRQKHCTIKRFTEIRYDIFLQYFCHCNNYLH